MNTSIEEIASEVFWRPGRVRNLTLDLRWNYITKVPNPGQNQWPGVPNTAFLHDILVAGNPLVCDCGIGYVLSLQARYYLTVIMNELHRHLILMITSKCFFSSTHKFYQVLSADTD